MLLLRLGFLVVVVVVVSDVAPRRRQVPLLCVCVYVCGCMSVHIIIKLMNCAIS